MSNVIRVALLVLLWLLAWGEASFANVVSGLLLAVLLLVAFPPHRISESHWRLDPLAATRLVLYVLRQLVTSNVLVAREIVTPGSSVRQGVLAYRVQHPSDEVITLMANVIALTPGTMTVEATTDPAILYVHFLMFADVDAARAGIARLERLAVAALGNPTPPPGRTVPPPPVPSPPVEPAPIDRESS